MRNSMRRPLPLGLIIIVLIVFACFSAWFVVWLPERELTTLKSNLTEKEIVELKNNIRLTYAQILGGMVILVGLFFTALRLRALEKEAQISRDGQITERFSKAVEQLGSENSAVCLGGVYALERIAHDSQYDHWSIVEILTTFVRDKAGWQTEAWNSDMSDIDELASIEMARANMDLDEFSEATSDFKPRYPHEEKPPKRVSTIIQTITTAIGRRFLAHEKGKSYRLNLRRTDLPKIELRGANLCGADFTEAHLDYADLTRAQLIKATFDNAHLVRSKLVSAILEQTNLNSAHLELADLEDANLKNAVLTKAYLLGTNLKNAKLRGANLFGAYFGKTTLSKENMDDDEPDNPIIPPYTWTDLTGADLRDANLFNTSLVHCTLEGTDLRGVDLSFTAMTPEQLKQAKVNDETKLPVIRPYNSKSRF